MTGAQPDLAPGPDVFFALTAHSHEPAALLDADGTFRYASPAFRQVLGYAPEDILGTNAFDYIHPEDHARVLAAFVAIVEADDGTPTVLHYRYRHADGSWRMLETTGSSHFKNPLVRAFIATSHDITEHRRAEERLVEQEAQYRGIFEATIDGLVILTLDGYIAEANPAFCAMYGYRYDEIIGMPATAFVHPSNHDIQVKHLEDARRGHSGWDKELGVRKDGTLFDVEAHGAMFSFKGTPHVLGIDRDISDRARAEAQLLEKEAQYRGIFEATSDGMVIIDFEGNVVEANPAFCAMYGYRYDEMIGLNVAVLSTAESRHVIEESFAAILADGSFHAEGGATHKDGTVFNLEAHSTMFTYKGQPHILGVARDITDRVRAKELLEQRVAERTRELSTLLDVSRNVASTLQLQPLLNLVLDQLGMVVEYTGAGISVLEGAEMRIAAYRGPGSQVLALDTRLPSASAGPLWEWMRRGEPVIIRDVRADSHEASLYRQSVGGHMNGSFSYVRSWMSVPLRVRDRDLGSVFLEHAQPNVYTPRHAELALAIARQAAIAIDNARLYEQVHEAAALEERQRLARELHDSVSQALYGIGLGATTARALLARDPQQVAAPLDYVITLAKAGLAEMRALIFELLPEALETEGLIAALTKQTAAVQARYGLAVDVMLGEEPEADLPAKQAIYRIAQEALHNVVKHARAGSIVLRLEASAGHLALEVRDDGMGFDAGGSFPGHLGLRSMRERATSLGGTLDAASTPGAGTRIRAQVPRFAVGPGS